MQITVDILTLERQGTEFIPRPALLHLGGQGADRVDSLHFVLPQSWAGREVLLYIERGDGTMSPPQQVDESGTVPVRRDFTQTAAGRWMLTASDAAGYHACTRPGRYTCYPALSTDAEGEEISPSMYERFVRQVMESANAAADSARRAAASAQTADHWLAVQDNILLAAAEALWPVGGCLWMETSCGSPDQTLGGNWAVRGQPQNRLQCWVRQPDKP